MPQKTLHHPLFGQLRIREAAGAIVAIDFGAGPADGEADADTPLLLQAGDALARYFETGKLPSGLTLAPAGTPYQQRVWAALRAIPDGETRTYGEIARVAGGSARAVGGANRANPIPILIPCHRVRAANGLGGYCGSASEGWGLEMKRRLLALEGAAAGANGLAFH